MNVIRYMLFAALLFHISSCGNICKKHQQTADKETGSSDSSSAAIHQGPTTIQMNKSIVLAEVLDLKLEGGSKYTLTVKVLEISEDPAYPSFAAKDITYSLNPDYGVNEQGELLKKRN